VSFDEITFLNTIYGHYLLNIPFNVLAFSNYQMAEKNLKLDIPSNGQQGATPLVYEEITLLCRWCMHVS